jgi:hypothetical protein
MAIVTDGIVNVPFPQPLNAYTRRDFMSSAQADVIDVSRLIARERIRTVIINTDHREERRPEGLPQRSKWLTPTELLMEVARITKGRYYGLTSPGEEFPSRPGPVEEMPTLVGPLIKHLAKSAKHPAQLQTDQMCYHSLGNQALGLRVMAF